MIYTLRIKRGLHHILLIAILSSTFGIIALAEAMCGKPGRTPICSHLDNKDEYNVRENITYHCNGCYSPDPMHRQCLENGSWSGKIPVCHRALGLENIQQLTVSGSGRKQENRSMDGDQNTCSNAVLVAGTALWKVVLTKPFAISVVKVVFEGRMSVKTAVLIKDGNKTEKICGVFDPIEETEKITIRMDCRIGLVGDMVSIFPLSKPRNAENVQLCDVTMYIQPDCLRPDFPYRGLGQKRVSSTQSKYAVRCTEGYELVGEREVLCQLDGTWTPSSSTCRKIHCGQLPYIANGFLRVNSTSVGSTAWLECKEGYRPLTDRQIHCLSTGLWTSSSLRCAPIQCDPNPIIRHGRGVLLSGSSLYGSKLQIICDRKYATIEEEPRQCYQNSTWGNLDICIEINCDPLSSEVNEGGQWISLNDTISIQVLICQKEYYIEGSPPVMQCLPNGTWSYTTAVCRRLPMNEGWSNILVESNALLSTITVFVGTAICILCLAMCLLVIKKWRQLKANTTVFHVGAADSSLHTDEARNTYEDVIELRHDLSKAKPRTSSSALPHLPMDDDPVYAQPFETSVLTKTTPTNTTGDLYTAHIYAEPVDSHQPPSGPNSRNSVAETWLQSGAMKFSRQMSLPGHSTIPERLIQQTNPSNIAICKPVFHSSSKNSMDEIFDKDYGKSEFEPKRQDTFAGLICNSIYLDINDRSLSTENKLEQLQMIDNEIYEDDYFSSA